MTTTTFRAAHNNGARHAWGKWYGPGIVRYTIIVSGFVMCILLETLEHTKDLTWDQPGSLFLETVQPILPSASASASASASVRTGWQQLSPARNSTIIRNRSGSRTVIVTINSGNDSELYDQVALINHQTYARCHGYDWINAIDMLTSEQRRSVHPYMYKAYALQAILETSRSFDWILWIDRDAIFVDYSMSLETRLEEMMWLDSNSRNNSSNPDSPKRNSYHYLYIAVEPWAWLNSGVMLFRKTNFSREILQGWVDVYESRQRYFNDSADTIELQGRPKLFRDLFPPTWSCEDQGALIALLAGYDETQKWNTDKFDGLGKPHVMHKGNHDWAKLSSITLLAPKYRYFVKIVAPEWLNTNPWDYQTYKMNHYRTTGDSGSRSHLGPVKPFIYHFNGQQDKPGLIQQYLPKVDTCPS